MSLVTQVGKYPLPILSMFNTSQFTMMKETRPAHQELIQFDEYFLYVAAICKRTT